MHKNIEQKILNTLDDIKAIDIISLDVSEHCAFFDKFIICTGRSSRHIKSIANRVSEACTELKLPRPHIEGTDESEWILVDMGDIIIHVMTTQSRAFYNLEELWSADLNTASA